MIAYNTAVVLLGCALLGLAAGTVGTFSLLRGRALVADAVGHAALPGVAIAALIVATLGGDPRALPPLLAGAATAGVLGVLAVQALARTGRIREDAAIAIVLSSFYALGVAILSWLQTQPGAAQAGLSKFILGQAAAMRAEDAVVAASVAAICLVVCLAAFQRLRAVCFDPDFCRMQGLGVQRVDLLLLGLLVLVCVAGLQAVGLILVVALLVLPAATARLLTFRLPRMLAISAVIGAVCGAAGAWVSALRPEVPTGAAVVLALAAVFTLALLLAPERGLLAQLHTHLRRRLAADTEHFLRAAWEAQEAAGAGPGTAGDRWAPIGAVAAARGWTVGRARWLAFWLAQRGLIARADGHVHLTPRGAAAARRAVRAHRAVEHHLLAAGATDIASADRLADLVEHGLPPEVAARLLPEPSALPASPHQLGERRP
ncbi:metal ABC transporter permease [Falsiroseomonas ponticola]|uniref:metal ABC transporter permease n=1 Tax=Falsiroseomonas ponticola TaxID=2786951 RepID=UPI00299E0F69|nr:iron chelate uptake ABC transporter family permease subunit [Roseomonas ponticola]